MSAVALANAIRSRYVAQVLPTQDILTQYDNQTDFTKPTDALWCRLTVLESITERIDIADHPRVRTTGNVIFNIFSPLGVGDGAARAFADLIASKYRHVTADGVKYRTPTVRGAGRDDAGWMINVIVPFQYNEIV